jgi:hypothetical protein
MVILPGKRVKVVFPSAYQPQNSVEQESAALEIITEEISNGKTRHSHCRR